jgi:hypothetical protein
MEEKMELEEKVKNRVMMMYDPNRVRRRRGEFWGETLGRRILVMGKAGNIRRK